MHQLVEKVPYNTGHP